MSFFKKLFDFLPHPPGPRLVPGSFAEKASPDHTFEIAGLTIGAHTQGSPKFGFTHFSVSRGHHNDAPVSAVPEPSSVLMVAVGLLAVVAATKLRRRA